VARDNYARDYYEVLGVQPTASTDEIQESYRRLARSYHPDVNADPSAEERFKEVNEAYQVLKDPKTRERYDRFGPDFRQIPEDFDERVAAGAGGRRRGGGRGRGRRARGAADEAGRRVDVDDLGGFGGGFGGFGGGIDIEDLLGGMFGARGGAGPLGGADQETQQELTDEEA
jgi:curved DNA-binding protein